MASDSRDKNGRSSSSKSEKRSEKSASKSKTDDAKKKAGEAAAKASDAAKTASKAVGSAVNSAADALGGVKDYNPTLYDFVGKSFLRKIEATNKASKFLVLVVGLGVIQSTVPIFAGPLDFFARLLSFVFLYNTGVEELKAGFGSSETRAYKVKSLLTVYIVTSMFDIIPGFAFDTTYHFGALWNFILPALLFVTPERKNGKETIAVWICDSVFSQISGVVDSIVPDQLAGSDQTTTFVIAGLLGLCLWTGLLGSTGSYMSVYLFLFVATTHHLGKDFVTPSASSSGFSAQMTIWHNLLAIWLWRCLISAVEGLQVPGIISVQGWILYHLPSYYLWMTGVFFLMLVTKKTASGGKANTWYANWLAGRFGSSKKSSSSSSSSKK